MGGNDTRSRKTAGLRPDFSMRNPLMAALRRATFGVFTLSFIGASLAGCTSNPNAPINQTPPIRQMDSFFNSLSAPAAPDYKHRPGYAPAYPPY